MFVKPLVPAFTAALLMAAAGSASAQAWPSKPIRLVVPYAAGGPADVIARLVAKKAGDTLGQTVIVENKAGAGGTIGIDAALKSTPDGYTWALTAQGPLAGMPNLMKAPYAIADIQYVTLVARGPAVVAVAKKVPADTLADLVKLAKSRPGKLNYGSAGPGTSPASCSSRRLASTWLTCRTRARGRRSRGCSAARSRSPWSICSTSCHTSRPAT